MGDTMAILPHRTLHCSPWGAFVHSARTARILQGEVGDLGGQLAIFLPISLNSHWHKILPSSHLSPTTSTLPYSWPWVARLETLPLLSEAQIGVIPTYLPTLGMVLNELCAQRPHSTQYAPLGAGGSRRARRRQGQKLAQLCAQYNILSNNQMISTSQL